MISVFSVLAFAVIILLIVNSGLTARHKVELQNAADAAAYSSALWQARSLNAVTASNHMMGELSALVTILDAFGGKMMAEGEEYSCDTSKDYSDKIKDFATSENMPKTGLINAGLPPAKAQLASFLEVGDEIAIKMPIETVNGEWLFLDDGKHEAGAAIYDAKLTLKYTAYLILFVKNLTNYLFIPAGILEKSGFWLTVAAGYAIDGAGVAIQTALTTQFVRVMTEWPKLHAVEKALIVIHRSDIRNIIVDTAIPAVSMYSDNIVGSQLTRQIGAGGSEFNVAVRETQSLIKRQHGLNSVQTYPMWNKLELPVFQEPEPITEEIQEAPLELGTWSYPESEWTGKFDAGTVGKIRSQASKATAKLKGSHGKTKKKMSGNVIRMRLKEKNLRDRLDDPDDVANKSETSRNKLIADHAKAKREREKAEKDAKDYNDSYGNAMKNMTKKIPEGPPKPPGCWSTNPCVSDKFDEDKLKLPKFYWKAERRTQWVRGTYPYVNEFRAPIVQFFKKQCKISEAATYFTNWSNRYTLATSFEVRTGIEGTDDSGHNSTDGNGQSADSDERTALNELRRKILEYRRDFDEASDDAAKENSGNGNEDTFLKISDEFVQTAREYESYIQSLDEWFQRIEDHEKVLQRAKQSAGDSIQGLLTDFEHIESLDSALVWGEELESQESDHPHMYVLRGMHPEGKGELEPWIRDRELAEDYFCITAHVSRSAPKVIGPKIFDHPSSSDRYALASALVYNANGRHVGNSPQNAQPNTGWDTLNWRTPVKAMEWGNHKPLTRSDVSIWKLLNPRPALEATRVRLNWQVKLVPLTERRLEQVGTVESRLRKFADFHELFHH